MVALRDAPVAAARSLHCGRAARHDRSALRELDSDLVLGCLFGDNAYSDAETKSVLTARDTHLVTLYKRERNEPRIAAPALRSRSAPPIRHP